MRKDNEYNSWNYGCTIENVDRMLAIYRNMVSEVESLENMIPVRHFTLDGHFIGSIGETIAAAYYNIQLAPSSTKAIDGAYNGAPVQIKITQHDIIPLSYDGKACEPRYLLVLYLNKNGSFYEVYNGPWSLVWDNNASKDSHGYQRVTIHKLMNLAKELSEDDKIAPSHSVPLMDKRYKNPSLKKGNNKDKISEFAQEYYEKYKRIPEDSSDKELIEDFDERCWELGFTMDTGEMFSALYGNEALGSAEDLQKVISSINDRNVLGSGIFSKWRYVTHWEFYGRLNSKENREWFIVAFSRLYELSK